MGRHVDGYNRNRPSKLIDAEHETRDGLTNRVAGTGSSRGATRSSVSDAMRSRVDKADISRGPRSAANSGHRKEKAALSNEQRGPERRTLLLMRYSPLGLPCFIDLIAAKT